jgi:hypothetical protein
MMDHKQAVRVADAIEAHARATINEHLPGAGGRADCMLRQRHAELVTALMGPGVQASFDEKGVR